MNGNNPQCCCTITTQVVSKVRIATDAAHICEMEAELRCLRAAAA